MINIIRDIIEKRAFQVLLTAFIICSSLIFSPSVYAETGSDSWSLNVVQTLRKEGEIPVDFNSTRDYVLTWEDGREATRFSLKGDSNRIIQFSISGDKGIVMNHGGLYRFHLKPLAYTGKDRHFKTDNTEYDITVAVENRDNGELAIEQILIRNLETGEKTDTVEYKNRYKGSEKHDFPVTGDSAATIVIVLAILILLSVLIDIIKRTKKET